MPLAAPLDLRKHACVTLIHDARPTGTQSPHGCCPLLEPRARAFLSLRASLNLVTRTATAASGRRTGAGSAWAIALPLPAAHALSRRPTERSFGGAPNLRSVALDCLSRSFLAIGAHSSASVVMLLTFFAWKLIVCLCINVLLATNHTMDDLQQTSTTESSFVLFANSYRTFSSPM